MYVARFDKQSGWRIVFESPDTKLDMFGAISEFVAQETARLINEYRRVKPHDAC